MKNKDKATFLKDNHEKWKKEALKDSGYFTVFTGLIENNTLNKMSGGALKLYVFLGIHSDNKTGESFYKIDSMAKYFDVSDRTISNWIKELESLRLIERLQLGYNSVSHTYLIPYASSKRGKKND